MSDPSADSGPASGAGKREPRLLWATAAAVAGFGTWMLYDALPGINWVLWTGAAVAGLLMFSRTPRPASAFHRTHGRRANRDCRSRGGDRQSGPGGADLPRGRVLPGDADVADRRPVSPIDHSHFRRDCAAGGNQDRGGPGDAPWRRSHATHPLDPGSGVGPGPRHHPAGAGRLRAAARGGGSRLRGVAGRGRRPVRKLGIRAPRGVLLRPARGRARGLRLRLNASRQAPPRFRARPPTDGWDRPNASSCSPASPRCSGCSWRFRWAISLATSPGSPPPG